MKDNFFAIGTVTTIRSYKGEIKVLYYEDCSEYFENGGHVFINDVEYTITNIIPYRHSAYYLKLDGVENEESARALVGSEIMLPEDERIALTADEYMVRDLIGMSVETLDGSWHGTIKEVLFCPANDVYIVEKESKEYLIPAVKDIVKEVDIIKRVMRIDPAIGMLD